MNNDFKAALRAGWEAFRAARRASQPEPEEAPVVPPESAVEQRYRSLFESATDLILTHDLDGKITSCNPAGERLLGWREEEIVGRNISELLACEERGIAAPLTPISTQNGVSFQLDLVTRDGRRLPVEISSWMETRDGKPVGRQAICRDLSERRAAEAERARLDHKLQESQKLESLGVLAGGVAHDFNNLLTSILGHASLARMDVSSGSSTGACLQQIEVAAERAASLCQQMLAYSGQGRFVVKRTDLAFLIRDNAELFRASISRKHVLDLRLDEALPSVMADASQVRQLLLGMVINASEAIGDQPGTITIATSLRQVTRAELSQTHVSPDLPEGEYLLLQVIDTGCGVDDAIRGKIFDPFFSTKFTGRGLGLAAALGIVRGHRGAIQVMSAPGEGTEFRVLLPSVGAPSLQAEFPFPTNAQSAGLVLVVDDEESIRTTTKRTLENLGYEVLTAVDGLDAVVRVRQHGARIGAVLLDLTMPRMDGVEAFREMLQLQPHLRVILISGFSEQHAIARFAGQGLSGFMQKPLTLAGLRTKLGNLLAEPVGV
jgi:PAS domain S-box-containing protein